MTHQISLRAMRAAGIDDVDAAVGAYLVELTQHTKHMKQVEKIKGKDLPIRPIWGDFAASKDPAAEFGAAQAKYEGEMNKRPQPYPAPIAHPDIMAAVMDGKADYEVVDDLPKPEEILQQKKNALFDKVSAAENDEVLKVTPPGKIRLFNMMAAEVGERDAELSRQFATKISEAKQDSPEQKRLIDTLNDPNFFKSRRTKADQQISEDFEARNKKIAAVRRWGAELHAEIEDLTSDNIDSWTFKPYTA